jgi:molybdenum cofactor biosynthesis protein B
MGADEHREQAAGETARFALLAVSDTRKPGTNTSGAVAADLVRKAGHEVAVERLVPNDPLLVTAAVRESLRLADLVVTIGGTGISRKDGSVEAVQEFVLRELPGFGELFRAMSAKEIGPAAILSRALLALTTDGRFVCCLPGSEGAVRLAFAEILLPEVRHLLREIRK